MKAWFVFVPDEWGELVHSETRGKAVATIMHEYGLEFTDLRAHRAKELDDKPITFQNSIHGGFPWVDEDGNPLKEIDYYNACHCEMCNAERDKK